MRPCILAIFVVLCAQNYLKMHTLLVPSYNVNVWPNSADKNPTHAFSRLQRFLVYREFRGIHMTKRSR